MQLRDGHGTRRWRKWSSTLVSQPVPDAPAQVQVMSLPTSASDAVRVGQAKRQRVTPTVADVLLQAVYFETFEFLTLYGEVFADLRGIAWAPFKLPPINFGHPHQHSQLVGAMGTQ